MVYKTNGKTYQIPDAELTALEVALGISRLEALDTWLDDHDIEANAEAEELNAQAKGKVKADSKTTKRKSSKPRKAPVRQPNPKKRKIITAITELLQTLETNGEISNVNTTNVERSIDFEMGGQLFSLNLVAHRTKK